MKTVLQQHTLFQQGSFILLILLSSTLNLFAMNLHYPSKFSIPVELLSAEQVTQHITAYAGQVDANLYKQLTARTYQLTSGKIILELYDGQGILFQNASDYKQGQDVMWIKSHLSYLKPQVSYKFELTAQEADKLILLHEGIQLKHYQAEDPEFYNIQVYQINTNQIIFSLHYSEQESKYYYLYENLAALAFDSSDISKIHYPDGYETGKKDFIQGEIVPIIAQHSYSIYHHEAATIIKNHHLKVVEKGIKIGSFYSNLYQSNKGYYMMMEDFEQLNAGGTEKIGIGEVTYFESYEQVQQQIQDYKKREEKMSHIPTTGQHIYHYLSKKYGREFPQHAQTIIKSLSKLLNLDEQQIGFSQDALANLNAAIEWNYGTTKYIEHFDEIITALLAYAGEYSKITKGGQWQMQLAQDGCTWEPWFIDATGNPAFDSIDFFKGFCEAEYGIPGVNWFIN